jgi:hypothetical protein
MTVYASRALRYGRRRYAIVTGTSPWVEVIFHPTRVLHDVALDMLKIESRYQRWPLWRPIPPRVWALHTIEVGDRDVVLGWLVTAWAIVEALRS